MINKKQSETVYFEDFSEDFSAPESVIVRNAADLYSKLKESESDVKDGKTVPAEIVFEKLRRKYGFSC